MEAAQLIAKWQSFVTEVESGYTLTIYDYTNDLSIRAQLEKEIRSNKVSDDELRVVTALDERFRQATRDSIKALPGAPDPGGWWVRRVPVNATGELAEDLREEHM